jgi:acetylglutamate kinase
MIRYGLIENLSEVLKKAETLLEALPYLQRFAGSKVVVKVGGEILASPELTENFARSVILLRSTGIKVVVCHGGGPQISAMMSKSGIKPKFINGQRVTCKTTLEVLMTTMLGHIAPYLTSKINQILPCAISISGTSSNMITAQPKATELGYVGVVDSIKVGPILQLLNSGYLPIITPLGIDTAGNFYNINGDSCAAALAKGLNAEKLILLSNIEGIYENYPDKKTLISEIDLASLLKLKTKGSFSEGMIPKIESVCDALLNGVSSAHILDGREPYSLLLEIFTASGVGTMIFP